ncbi:MAG: PorT family protein [Bacteroidia bacterium]|nr:PorT family protein [Bacteroidia bacterium]
MKKVVLSLLWLIFVAANVHGQSFMYFGLRGYPQYSSILNKQDSDAGSELDYDLTIGWGAGGAIGINFTNSFGIETGIYYANQGQKYKGAFKVGNMDTTFNSHKSFSTLKIPLFFKLNTNPDGFPMFTLYAGPQYSMITNANYKVNGAETGVSIPNQPNVSFKDLYKKGTIEIAGGLGLDYWFAENMYISTHLRGEYSLEDIEDEQFKPANRSVASNLTVGFVVGLGFVLTFDNKPFGRYGLRFGS